MVMGPDSLYIIGTSLNPGGGIYKAENFSPVSSMYSWRSVFTPFCMEITQPGPFGSGVHK